MNATTRTRNLIDRWMLLAWLGAGALLFWGAVRYTVFDDEAFSCRLYVMPMGEMLRALWNGADPDPPLYYVLQNAWVHVFGVGPLGLRSLSIVFFLVGLVVMRAAARLWFDARTGLWALVLCALHPAHLFFGFSGRWYSLMFLMVALLLWVSARLRIAADARPRLIIGWAMIAAGVCYTNYFGPVVVGFVWIAAAWRIRRRSSDLRRWLIAALGAVILCLPWFVPLWRQMSSFAAPTATWQSIAATAGRTLMTLLTGNLASMRAWWVWAPMAVFCAVFAYQVIRHRRRVWPLAVVVLGCFAAGVASRTMIDKYVMTFSGPTCLLVAAVMVRSWRGTRVSNTAPGGSVWSGRSLRRHLMPIALALGWLGCGVNLVTLQHWSSLRWLDPFEQVTRSLYEQNWHRTYPDAVTSHPSARYYFAKLRADDPMLNSVQKRIMPGLLLKMRTDAAEWRAARQAQENPKWPSAFYALTPTAMTTLLDAAHERAPSTPHDEIDKPLTVIATLETSGFASLPEWDALHTVLDNRYDRVDEPAVYLEDPDAAWKDRIDPAVRHSRWRIVVHHWQLRE